MAHIAKISEEFVDACCIAIQKTNKIWVFGVLGLEYQHTQMRMQFIFPYFVLI